MLLLVIPEIAERNFLDIPFGSPPEIPLEVTPENPTGYNPEFI